MSKVSLKVYNILGKEIVTLINEVKPFGQYTVNFNAGSLPSGITSLLLKQVVLLRQRNLFC
jgi:hypothetical protein